MSIGEFQPTTSQESQFVDLESNEILSQLSPEQRKAVLIEMINELPEGRKDYDVFLAIAKKMPLTCIEVTPVRINPETGKTEVLLIQRPKNDIWEGQWHVPGSVIMSSDESEASADEGGPYKDAVARVLGSELLNSLRVVSKQQELRTEFRSTPRSKELAVVSYFEVEGQPTVGAFFPVGETIENVPGEIIEHQVQFIIDCARDFEAKKASQTNLA